MEIQIAHYHKVMGNIKKCDKLKKYSESFSLYEIAECVKVTETPKDTLEYMWKRHMDESASRRLQVTMDSYLSRGMLMNYLDIEGNLTKPIKNPKGFRSNNIFKFNFDRDLYKISRSIKIGFETMLEKADPSNRILNESYISKIRPILEEVYRISQPIWYGELPVFFVNDNDNARWSEYKEAHIQYHNKDDMNDYFEFKRKHKFPEDLTKHDNHIVYEWCENVYKIGDILTEWYDKVTDPITRKYVMDLYVFLISYRVKLCVGL